MKKKLLSLALLSAFAGAASAQSNVTVYGLIDTSVIREDSGAPAGATIRMDSGWQYGSRLGFKGTEDLGGGLAANFNLEIGFNSDTGALLSPGVIFDRQAWVGLKGRSGSVRLGRMWSPYYLALLNLDPFADGTVGNATALMSAGGLRISNAIDYETPNFGGFSGEIAYGLGEVAGSTSANRVLNLRGDYENGPFAMSVAHYNRNNSVAAGGSNKSTLVIGAYDFKVARVHLGYDWNKGDTNAGGTVADNRDLVVGVRVPVGTGTAIASYIRKTDKLIANADARRYAIGYIHPLSKRTELYTAYARTSNDSAGRSNLDASAPSGASDSAIQAGIVHRF
jgi:predicted porin